MLSFGTSHTLARVVKRRQNMPHARHKGSLRGKRGKYKEKGGRQKVRERKGERIGQRKREREGRTEKEREI